MPGRPGRSALFALAARRGRISLPAIRSALSALVAPPLVQWQRVLWIALIGWLLVHFALMGAEVSWRPLYPWDAWVQWATKARVWYELGHLAPFVRTDEWLAGASGAFFDASPNYPATLPLLQVWTCVAIGRWDLVGSRIDVPPWAVVAALGLLVPSVIVNIMSRISPSSLGAIKTMLGTLRKYAMSSSP